jgi:hypothetical protein
MLTQGYVPKGFGDNVIIPVIKNRNGNCNDACNYRPISIEPICTKLFEQCLVPLLEPFLNVHVNQFGFVARGGCNKALFAFRSTVDYFISRGSKVFVASLDLSKAFDRVNHYGLLRVLLERGVPLCLINVLWSWFSKLEGMIYWNCSSSRKFVIKSGVPEGSINGPKFFNCIMDVILNALESQCLGCYVKGCFLGGLAYADDLLLLSSSLCMLQVMLDVCCGVGVLFDLKFNATKTVCGVFGVS